MRNKLFASALLLLTACRLQTQENQNAVHNVADATIKYKSIGDIPVPTGYERVTVEQGSFGDWLRAITLKKDNRVFLYNGALKENQKAQFAVLDIPVGNKDLQQCADAVMRLNAEYNFSKNDFAAIAYHATDGTLLSFADWRNGKRFKLSGNRLQPYFITGKFINARAELESYLETVFSYAGTTSLAAELKAVRDISDMQAGDVFVKPGFPGHAMLVADVAINKEGEKIFMLVQSYMPAQDIHLVKNPANDEGNPWYKINNVVQTPEWTFRSDQLKEKK